MPKSRANAVFARHRQLSAPPSRTNHEAVNASLASDLNGPIGMLCWISTGIKGTMPEHFEYLMICMKKETPFQLYIRGKGKYFGEIYWNNFY
jgi:hypothetical protein